MKTAIEIKNLRKSFREVQAVDGISFKVEEGELFGFLGVNGAGKSTTINMLCTLYRPDGGEAWIGGHRLGREDAEIRRKIGVVYQQNTLDDRLLVKENIAFRGALYVGREELRRNFSRLCEVLRLEKLLERPFGQLPGGQKRRCEIAAALLHTPDILFLDKPTTGLDPASRKDVWETIQRLQREQNMTILLTTHYMEEAAISDHIGVIDKGRLKEYGTPFYLKDKYVKDYLYLFPMEAKGEEICEHLARQQQVFQTDSGRITVELERTLGALPILERLGDLLEGFEVIQGTIDDAFLQITKGAGQ